MPAETAHEHLLVQDREPAHQVDAVPFHCAVPGCVLRVHPRACHDDEGKLECVCGLDDERERAHG